MASKISASLLDNLWLWASLVTGIMLVYGVWALLETIGMHGMSAHPHSP